MSTWQLVCKPEVPYLINVNEDGFRNNRFIYLIDKDQIIFGPGNDCQPMSFTIVANHCKITKIGAMFRRAMQWRWLWNGVKLKKNEKRELKHLDAFENDLHTFLVPGEKGEPMSPDDVRKALCLNRASLKRHLLHRWQNSKRKRKSSKSKGNKPLVVKMGRHRVLMKRQWNRR